MGFSPVTLAVLGPHFKYKCDREPHVPEGICMIDGACPDTDSILGWEYGHCKRSAFIPCDRDPYH